MNNFSLWLVQRNPHLWFLEEVEGFNRPLRTLGHRSPLQLFAEEVSKLGYRLAVFLINHIKFIKVSRPRIRVLAFQRRRVVAKLPLNGFM